MATTTRRRIRNRQCICSNDKQCRGMSLAFQILEDPRGGHVEVPRRSSVNPPEYEFLHRMNQLRIAYFRILGGVSDDNSNSNDKQEYVALHHFHPKVVQKLAESSGGSNNSIMGNNLLLQVPLTLKPAEVRRLGWHPSKSYRVYNLQGQPTDDFYFVPDYPIESGHFDLKQLSRAERSSKEISLDVYQKAQQAIAAARKKNGTATDEADHHHKSKKHREKQQQRKRERKENKKESNKESAAANSLTQVEGGEPLTPRLEQLVFGEGSNKQESEGKDTPSLSTEPLPEQELMTEETCKMPSPNCSPIAEAVESDILSPLKPKRLDASDTLNGSYSVLAVAESRRNDEDDKGDALGASDSTVVHGSCQQAFDHFNASNTTVVNGGGHDFTSSSTNLNHASAVSLQVTDTTLMQASESTFHASDLTVRASGAAAVMKRFHESDTTVPTSNTWATRQRGSNSSSSSSSKLHLSSSSKLNLSQIALDLPRLEELAGKETNEPPREGKQPTPSNGDRPSSTTEVQPQSSRDGSTDFSLLKELPKRKRDALPSCDELLKTPPAAQKGLASSPPRRKSSIRERIKEEVLNDSASELRTSSLAISVGNNSNEVDVPCTPQRRIDARFCCTPPLGRLSDASPSTPRRMVSNRNLCEQSDDHDEIHEEPSTDKPDKVPPSSPQRVQSVRKVESYEGLSEKTAVGNTSPVANSLRPIIKTTANVTGGMQSPAPKEVTAMKSHPDDGLDSKRRAAMSLLESRQGRIRSLPRRSRSASSPPRNQKDMPLRTKSADDGTLCLSGDRRYRRRRSDTSSSGDPRRRSDITMLGRRSTMSDSSGRSRSRLGASRRIDTTHRALRQYSEGFHKDNDGSEPNRNRRIPRRLTNDIARSRSGSPVWDLRRGRRGAMVARDADDPDNFPRRGRRAPRRTKSAESPLDESIDISYSSLVAIKKVASGKRSSDPSPVRSQSPKRTLRRTKSDVPNLASPRRRNRRSKRTGDERSQTSRKSGLSPRNSPPRHTKSELSPFGGRRNIKRIDSTLNAMKQFIHDTGTGSDLGADRSPRRPPRRTRSRSRKSPMRSRSCTPTRLQSPRRTTTSLIVKSDHRYLNNSSPAVIGNGSEMDEGRLESSITRLDYSSPAVLTGPPVRRAKTDEGIMKTRSPDLKSDTKELSSHEHADSVSSEPSLSDSTISSANSTNTSHSGGCEMSVENDGAMPTSPSADPAAGNTRFRQSLAIGDLDQRSLDSKSREINESAGGAAKETIAPDSLYAGHIQRGDAARRQIFHESLTLEDIITRKIAAVPASFNLSYPPPKKQERRKTVDWESLGFYSSSEQLHFEAASEESKGPTTFALPRRLVTQKARQQLLTEVVVTAHRRQTIAAKRQDAAGMAVRRESKMVMNEVLAAVKEKAQFTDDFGEEVAKDADTLLKRDRAGQLDAFLSRRKASLETSAGQATSVMSLSLNQVFDATQDVAAAGLLQTTKKANGSTILDGSSMSLSLRKVFEESVQEESETTGGLFERATPAQHSDHIAPDQLRTVFPFKTIREKRRGSSLTGSGSLWSTGGSQDNHVRTDSGEDSLVSTPEVARVVAPEMVAETLAAKQQLETGLKQCTHPSKDWFHEKLPDISEEPEAERRISQESKQSIAVIDTMEQPLGIENSQGSLPPLVPLEECEERQNEIQESAPSPEKSKWPKLDSEVALTPPESVAERKTQESYVRKAKKCGDSIPSSPKRRETMYVADIDSTPDGTKQGIVEFHLSFPSELTMVSRALPTSADACLRKASSGSSIRGRKRNCRKATNVPCNQERLDQKIDNLEQVLACQDIQVLPRGTQVVGKQAQTNGQKDMLKTERKRGRSGGRLLLQNHVQ